MEIDPSSIVTMLGSGSAGALILWFAQRFINKNDKKHDEVDEHRISLATLKMDLDVIKQTLARIEAAVDRLEDRREKHREEFLKVKSSVDAAWRAIDNMKGH